MSDIPQAITPPQVYDDIPAAHEVLVDTFGFAPGGVTRDSPVTRFTKSSAWVR